MYRSDQTRKERWRMFAFARTILPLLLLVLYVSSVTAESILRCVDEFGPNNTHSRAMDALDGKRIFFVGDSITRYQYLELAYFAAHKRCPDPLRPDYVLSESWYGGFNDFYAHASASLEVNTDTHRTSELSMATRIKLRPLRVCEHRTFHYEDAQGRSFDLVYQQYFNEGFSRLKTAMTPATALSATDVVFNFGVWLRREDEACGKDPASECPDVPWVCDFIHSKHHPFRVWWLATTPTAIRGQAIDEVPLGHPMNMQSACDVKGLQLIDRAAVLSALEPSMRRRTLLFWSSEGPHFHADANHGFNQALLHRLPHTPSPKPSPLPLVS
eukprot:jgi/Ulvmu1/2586/UM014_0037.1